jgi:hypothetical protein
MELPLHVQVKVIEMLGKLSSLETLNNIYRAYTTKTAVVSGREQRAAMPFVVAQQLIQSFGECHAPQCALQLLQHAMDMPPSLWSMLMEGRTAGNNATHSGGVVAFEFHIEEQAKLIEAVMRMFLVQLADLEAALMLKQKFFPTSDTTAFGFMTPSMYSLLVIGCCTRGDENNLRVLFQEMLDRNISLSLQAVNQIQEFFGDIFLIQLNKLYSTARQQ